MIWIQFICLFSIIILISSVSSQNNLRNSEDAAYKRAIEAVNTHGHSIVHCSTTKGDLDIEIMPYWSPIGAENFLKLVKIGFYTDIALFRCVSRFLVQFGISDKPEMKKYHNMNILDDPTQNRGIKKHYLSYAGGGVNTRSTQLFIAFEDLDFLGKEPWETPFGRVVRGEDTLNKLYKGYGDIHPFGKGPSQQKIHNRGNKYIHDEFPKIDFINSCEITHSPTQTNEKIEENNNNNLNQIGEENKEENQEEIEEEVKVEIEDENEEGRGGEHEAISTEIKLKDKKFIVEKLTKDSISSYSSSSLSPSSSSNSEKLKYIKENISTNFNDLKHKMPSSSSTILKILLVFSVSIAILYLIKAPSNNIGKKQ